VMMKGLRVGFCWGDRSCLINCRIAVKGSVVLRDERWTMAF
jgi:hypothetical protein